MKKILCTTLIFFLFLSLFLEISSEALLITPDNPDEKTFPGGKIEYKIILDYTGAEKSSKTHTYTPPPTTVPPTPSPPPDPPTSSSTHLEIGAKRATVKFSLSKVPEGWDVDFKYGIETYSIDPGDKKEVFLIAKVPKETEIGKYEIEVKIQSDAGVYDPLKLKAEVLEKDLEVLSIQYSPEDPKDGEIVSVMAQVRNNSPDDRDVKTRLLVDYNTIEYQTIPIPSGDTKSVVFTWIAVEGDHKLGVHALEIPGEPDKSNNALYVDITVIKLPIGEADALFQKANTYYYNGEFAKAKQYYNLAKELYEQIPNQDRIDQCNLMIENCNKYLQALALIDQAEDAFEAGDCDKAIELYNQAISIYEELKDTSRMEEAKNRLEEIEEACKPPLTTTPPPPPTFFQKYKTYLAALVVIALLLFLYFMATAKKPKKKKEPEKIIPVVPVIKEEKVEKEEKKEEKPTMAEKEKLLKLHNGTEKILKTFTPEYIKDHIEEAVDVYSVLIKERNEMKRGIDPELEEKIEKNIKAIEEKIFSQL